MAFTVDILNLSSWAQLTLFTLELLHLPLGSCLEMVIFKWGSVTESQFTTQVPVYRYYEFDGVEWNILTPILPEIQP